MRNRFKISIFDINFICSIWGFAILTSVMPNVESITLRFVFLFISLFCLLQSGVKTITCSKDANLYIALLVLMLLRVSLDVLFGSLSDAPPKGKIFFFLYAYGIVFIPVISVVSTYNKLNWNTLFVLLHFILLLIILASVMMADSTVEDSGRVAMNERQDSSTLGEYSAILLLLSLVQLVRKIFSKKLFNWIYKLVCIAGIVISFYGVTRGASRGAFVNYLVVILYFTYCTSKSFRVWLAGVLIILFGISATLISWLGDFAPLLIGRMTRTVEDGDTSGREVLWQQAIRLLEENPIFPSHPIMISQRFHSYHGLYFDVALYLGIIGGIIFIFFIIKTFYGVLKVKTREPVSLFFLTLFMVNAIRGLSGIVIFQDPMFSIVVIFTCILLYKKKKLKSYNASLTN